MKTEDIINHKRRMHEDQQQIKREAAAVQEILNGIREGRVEMSESGPEKLQRVRQMAHGPDSGHGYDLSPKNQLALRYALEMIDGMALDLAMVARTTPEEIIKIGHSRHDELK